MYRKILVASDLSENADPALVSALSLGEKLGAAVVALHVTPPSYESHRWYAPLVVEEIEFYRNLARKEQDAALLALQDRLATLGARHNLHPATEAVVRAGEPAEVVIALAGELGCDLVVVGTHGRRGLSHLMLGSVAERVVRTSTCPVLTVRGPA